MIITIVKNISKTDTKNLQENINILPLLTPNKLKNTKGMVKTFWPFKTYPHIHTHTPMHSRRILVILLAFSVPKMVEKGKICYY